MPCLRCHGIFAIWTNEVFHSCHGKGRILSGCGIVYRQLLVETVPLPAPAGRKQRAQHAVDPRCIDCRYAGTFCEFRPAGDCSSYLGDDGLGLGFVERSGFRQFQEMSGADSASFSHDGHAALGKMPGKREVVGWAESPKAILITKAMVLPVIIAIFRQDVEDGAAECVPNLSFVVCDPPGDAQERVVVQVRGAGLVNRSQRVMVDADRAIAIESFDCKVVASFGVLGRLKKTGLGDRDPAARAIRA